MSAARGCLRPALLLALIVHAARLEEVRAADWPTWRHDANRSAATAAELPAQLHLQWKRTLHPPRPAFPSDPRLCFDSSYEPVVMGKTLFVPSMVTDSVTALDTRTGAVRWEFFADGPVRFAPIAWRGKVYFVSDDGHLYCVEAGSGKLVWKARGAPAHLADHKLLGNGRLISRWPARGGPVLAGDVIYFAAGVWPFEGVYVCAVGAETGKLLWRNSQCSFIEKGLIDHGTRRDTGLSPQGYLAVIGGKLVVPNGRALPAFFNLRTGEMEPYTTGWGGRDALAKGCWYVSGIGDYWFQSGDLYALGPRAASAAGPYELKELWSFDDFAELAGVPLETVQEWTRRKLLETVERDGKRFVRVPKRPGTTHVSWWMGAGRPGEQHAVKAYPRLQIDPANDKRLGVFREPVLTEGAIYYSRPVKANGRKGGKSGDRIVARDITKAKWGVTCEGGWGTPSRFVVWRNLRFDALWSLPSKLKVHIKAGSRLYAGGPGVVAAVDIPTQGGEPKISWRSQIEGTPSRMLAADGKLFVVSREGAISCFGAKEVPPKTYVMGKPGPPAADKWTRTAGEILKHTGVTESYCLALGLGTGRLVEELARQSKLHVIAIESDVKKVEAVRRKLGAMGLYGTRLHIVPGDLMSLRLPPYMTGLTVSENLKGTGFERGKGFVEKLFRSMRPYGGVACLPVAHKEHAIFAGWVKEAKLTGAEVKRAGGFTLLARAGALPGSDDWSHESGTAGNTFTSADQRVKPPFGVLWFGGELDRIRCAGPAPVICRGRMFVRGGNALHAFDIYTGRPLWKAPGASFGGFAAVEDGVHVIRGNTCLRLDPATGLKTGEISVPAERSNKKPASWQEVRIWKDYLIGTSGKNLFCMDRQSGKMLWKFQSRQDRFGFAVGAGKVFCVDYWLPVHRRRGEQKPDESTVFALDVRGGKVLWQSTAKTPEDTPEKKGRNKPPTLKPQLAYCDASDILVLTANDSTLRAYKGETGNVLWAKDIPCQVPPANWRGYVAPNLLPDLLITQAGALYDPRTGSRLPKRLWKGANVNSNSGGTRGCGRAVANEHIVALRDGDASYFELATGRQTFLRGIRSGCTNSLLPAGGILNAPNFAHGCSCNWPIFTSFALAHMPQAARWRPAPSPK